MRAMRAESFNGYKGLKLVDLPKPAVTEGEVLVRITAAGGPPPHHTNFSRPIFRSEGALFLGDERRGGGGGGGGVGAGTLAWRGWGVKFGGGRGGGLGGKKPLQHWVFPGAVRQPLM